MIFGYKEIKHRKKSAQKKIISVTLKNILRLRKVNVRNQKFDVEIQVFLSLFY